MYHVQLRIWKKNINILSVAISNAMTIMFSRSTHYLLTLGQDPSASFFNTHFFFKDTLLSIRNICHHTQVWWEWEYCHDNITFWRRVGVGLGAPMFMKKLIFIHLIFILIFLKQKCKYICKDLMHHHLTHLMHKASTWKSITYGTLKAYPEHLKVTQRDPN